MTPKLPVGNGQWISTTLCGAEEEEKRSLAFFLSSISK
jgi:hypothetical protein